jgi:hypothetical protein
MMCRKRETLAGDATLRYYDYLEGFDAFEGIVPNLFTGARVFVGGVRVCVGRCCWFGGSTTCRATLQRCWLPLLVACRCFTEISTSKERSFAAVDFVDTPGLVDGDMKV